MLTIFLGAKSDEISGGPDTSAFEQIDNVDEEAICYKPETCNIEGNVPFDEGPEEIAPDDMDASVM